MDTKNRQDDNWIEDLLYPLLEVLECIQILEIYTFGLNRVQFISNENESDDFWQLPGSNMEKIYKNRESSGKWLLAFCLSTLLEIGIQRSYSN